VNSSQLQLRSEKFDEDDDDDDDDDDDNDDNDDDDNNNNNNIHEFMYRDTTNVEPEMYDYTSNNY